MAVQITEEFDDPLGRYTYYDTYDITLLDELKARAHTNLRSFYGDSIVVPLFVYQIHHSMGTIDDLTMEELEGSQTLRGPEPWTLGTLGPDSGRGMRNTLRFNATGTTVTESVMEPLDLRAWTEGSLSLTLPGYPGNLVTSARLTLIGDTTLTLPFSGTSGGGEVAWDLADIVLPHNITTVRFSFTMSAGATITIAALRLLSPGWTSTRLDMDTRTQRLVPNINPDGSLPLVDFPRVWRAADPPGDDPRPINGRVAFNIYTGSMTAANHVNLFLRGRREDFLTQLDLDGTDDGTPTSRPTYGDNQWSLDQRGRQPDYGQAVYNPRPQSDLDTFTQGGLDTPQRTQAQLERLSDTISESWVEVRVTYGTTNEVVIGTTETLTGDSRYTLPVTGLEANQTYLLEVIAHDSSIRVVIRLLNGDGSVGSVVFDSYTIDNDFEFKRRKGRIGWELMLNDGDSWIESIRSSELMFGEVVTNNFESFTPVEGAQIFANATPDCVLTTGLVTLGDATMDLDIHNSRSTDGALKITAGALSGIQSAPVVFEDFEHTQITFDIYVPVSNMDTPLYAGLLNQRGFPIMLLLPRVLPDQWQSVTISLKPASSQQTGTYSFILLQGSGTGSFWIDNLNVVQQSCTFAARATLDDAWGRFNDQWLDVGRHINSNTVGALFAERGRFLQVRAQALTQDARIMKLHAKPKYAELGRLVWDVGRKYA